jgi:hypothetical protein
VSVFLVFSVGPDGQVVGGPDLATTSGWLALLDWAEPLRDFPGLARFAEECTLWSAAEIDALERELPEAIRAHADTLTPELTLTLGRLLEAIHDRPGGAVALIATDGTDGDDGEDDDEDNDQDDDQDEDEDGDEETARPGPAAAAPQADPAACEGLETGMPTPAAGAATPAQLRAAENKARLTGEPPAGGWQNDTRELRYERAAYALDGPPGPATPAPETQPAPEAKAPLGWPPEWGAPEITY